MWSDSFQLSCFVFLHPFLASSVQASCDMVQVLLESVDAIDDAAGGFFAVFEVISVVYFTIE